MSAFNEGWSSYPACSTVPFQGSTCGHPKGDGSSYIQHQKLAGFSSSFYDMMGKNDLRRCRATAEGPAAADIMHFGTANHTSRKLVSVTAKYVGFPAR